MPANAASWAEKNMLPKRGSMINRGKKPVWSFLVRKQTKIKPCSKAHQLNWPSPMVWETPPTALVTCLVSKKSQVNLKSYR